MERRNFLKTLAGAAVVPTVVATQSLATDTHIGAVATTEDHAKPQGTWMALLYRRDAPSCCWPNKLLGIVDIVEALPVLRVAVASSTTQTFHRLWLNDETSRAGYLRVED